jgi:LysR family transcriptional regulator, hypochlorite-specific transcription factor HypT
MKPRPMQQKWLEDLIAVAQTRSFARAAELRNVTQPAFGRRIKALEDWLGTALIDRTAYPTQLTEAGQHFLNTAREVCRSLDDARASFSGRVASNNTLRIATGRTLGHTLFPEWLIRTQKAVGNFKAEVWSGSLHDAMLRIEQGDVDLSLCYGHPVLPLALDAQLFSYKVVGEERLVAVTAQQNSKPLFSLTGTATIPCLALAPTLALARLLSALLPKDISARLQTVHRADFAEPLLPLVRAGLGLAWLPLSLVNEDLAKGELVRAWPSEQDIRCEVRLVKATGNSNVLVNTIWNLD